jgi:prevent-host-death family protein
LVLYALGIDVGVSALRAHLKDWLDRASAGEDIVVTDRGVPVARLVGLESTSVIEELTRQGLVSRPASPERPRAAGRRRVRARGSVSDLVSAQRR